MLPRLGVCRNRSGGFDAVFCRKVARSCSTHCQRVSWSVRCARRWGPWRERFYAPLVALRLFMEQVLHADHACQDVVVRYASERAAQGEAKVSLSTGPYCKARQRLPLGLVTVLRYAGRLSESG